MSLSFESGRETSSYHRSRYPMRNAGQVIYTAPMNSVACFRFRPSWHTACVIVLLATTSACGQTGDLYRPDPTADMIEVRKPGTVVPGSEKKTRKRGAADNGAQSEPSDGPLPAEDAPAEDAPAKDTPTKDTEDE